MSLDPTSASSSMPATAPPRDGLRVSPWVGLILALVGAAVTWVLIERYWNAYQVPKEHEIKALGESEERWARFNFENAKAQRHNAIFRWGMSGALVTGLIGLGESIARRSMLPVLLAAPLGAGFGCLAGYCGALVHESFFDSAPLRELDDLMAVHAALLGVLGLGVGLTLGLCGRSLATLVMAALAGLVLGLVTAMLFPLAMSLLMPGVNTDTIFPRSSVHRLLWLELIAGLLGLGIPAISHMRLVRRQEIRARANDGG